MFNDGQFSGPLMAKLPIALVNVLQTSLNTQHNKFINVNVHVDCQLEEDVHRYQYWRTLY